MYTDLRMGRRLELDWLNRLMVKLGDEVGCLPDRHASRAPACDGSLNLG